MRELLPGIYETELTSDQGTTRQIHTYLIPGQPGERSLMVDTGYRKRNCLEEMKKNLAYLGIRYEMLDIFLTHKHHDHTGLASFYESQGARLFMSAEENRHPYDCLYYNQDQGDGEDQFQVLRSVGVTQEETPEIWEMFMEIRRRVESARGWEYEVKPFFSCPIVPGQEFAYGDYQFQAISLRGHTYGQMGLIDPVKRLLFSGDQVIDGIVPIVGTTYPDEHLLQSYFQSLKSLKHEYGDCLLLPAHGNPISGGDKVIDRIIFSYLDKIDRIKRTLDACSGEMTVREIGCEVYGMGKVPESTEEFVKLKMVMSKTFSCLEYLRDLEFAERTEKEGVFYWRSVRR